MSFAKDQLFRRALVRSFNNNSRAHAGFGKTLCSSLAFSLVAGLSACSSKQTQEDSNPLDSAMTETQTTNTSSDQAIEEGTAATTSGPATDKWYGSRRASEVKDQPFQAEGRWMNAFYFVRSPEESWQSLSQMIYGRADRSDILASWNRQGTLKVGRVIYYNSALRPEDSTTMKVFAEDFGQALQQITVAKGESLSSIAQRLYGHPMSWKEIAALNPSIKNPDTVQVGQQVAVQPAQIDTKSIVSQVVSQAGQQAVPSDSTNNLSNGTNAPPDDSDAELAQLDPSKEVLPPPTKKMGFNINSSLIMAAGGAIVLLALIAFVIRKRMQAKQYNDLTNVSESWDDNNNVTKLTRPKTGN